MEDLLAPSDQDKRQFFLLIGAVLLFSFILMFFDRNFAQIKEGSPVGRGSFKLTIDDNGILWGTTLEERGPIHESNVQLNYSPLEDLVVCPGIGSKTALVIVKERRNGRFLSWEDFQRRIPRFGSQRTKDLKDAGVKLGD